MSLELTILLLLCPSGIVSLPLSLRGRNDQFLVQDLKSLRARAAAQEEPVAWTKGDHFPIVLRQRHAQAPALAEEPVSDQTENSQRLLVQVQQPTKSELQSLAQLLNGLNRKTILMPIANARSSNTNMIAASAKKNANLAETAVLRSRL